MLVGKYFEQLKSSELAHSPTDPFSVLELQNLSHDKNLSERHKIIRSPDRAALKLWKVRSGREKTDNQNAWFPDRTHFKIFRTLKAVVSELSKKSPVDTKIMKWTIGFVYLYPKELEQFSVRCMSNLKDREISWANTTILKRFNPLIRWWLISESGRRHIVRRKIRATLIIPNSASSRFRAPQIVKKNVGASQNGLVRILNMEIIFFPSLVLNLGLQILKFVRFQHEVVRCRRGCLV